MKKTSTIFSVIALMMVFSSTLLAQTIIENTTAGAKVGKELAITETAALHFGTMTIPTGAVNVVLSTVNVRTASIPARITLLSQAPVCQNAAYTVYGGKNEHYDIALPANNVVTIVSGPNHMHVDSFTARTASQGNGTTGKLSALGIDSFVIGATLKLMNGQPSGLYTGTFDVTVNYH